jgi:hypothetical protein
MSQLNNEFCPSCPTDCGEFTLPSFSDACFSQASIEESEIVEIFLSEPSNTLGIPKNPITGHTVTGLPADATINEAAILSWIDTKNNSTAGALRSIKGIGDKPAATGTDVTGPEGVIIQIDKTHPINFDILTMDNLNYEAVRWLQCNPTLHLWFRTKKYLYGGENGMIATVRNADHILARGQGSIGVSTLVFEFKSTCAPIRDAFPTETPTE